MEELEKELKNLKDKEFMLNMCDNWDDSDYKYSWQLRNKIKKIESKLKELK